MTNGKKRNKVGICRNCHHNKKKGFSFDGKTLHGVCKKTKENIVGTDKCEYFKLAIGAKRQEIAYLEEKFEDKGW